MRIRRVDNNQKSLVYQIRQIPGTTVLHTHELGEGAPDLLVGFKKRNYLFEVKDPIQPKSKRKLTNHEEDFHKTWTGQVNIIETIDDVLKIISAQVATRNNKRI